MNTATHRGALASIKTGNGDVDGVIGDFYKGPGHPHDDDKPKKTPLQELYDDALTKGKVFSLGRAVKAMVAEKRLNGLEAEVNQEMTKQMGRSARGFWVPWDAPVERRNLTTTTGPGSITAQIPYMLMIDILRPKLAIARLGGRILNLIGNGSSGTVELSTKSAASVPFWVSEGAAPNESNFVTQGFVMRPYTATAYSDVTRRMLKLGAPGFETHVVNDIVDGIANAVDGTALNGNSPFQPLGLFQFAGVPNIKAHGDTGNGGTLTYSNLVAMNQSVGLVSGDAPTTSRLGWVTSPQGKATLQLTDKSATASTGRYCWESHEKLVDGQLITCESVLGYPAVATMNAPSALTEGSATNITALAHGNFDNCWVNLFSGFDCILNPFLQSSQGVIRISGFQDVDVRFVRPESFCLCTNIIAASPQTS
jgi:HK97 family phage major capsid protein